jgi:hypothetical protein
MRRPRTSLRYTETKNCSLAHDVTAAGFGVNRTDATSTVDEELRIPPPFQGRVPGSGTKVRVEKCLERIALVLSPRHSLKGSRNG